MNRGDSLDSSIDILFRTWNKPKISKTKYTAKSTTASSTAWSTRENATEANSTSGATSLRTCEAKYKFSRVKSEGTWRSLIRLSVISTLLRLCKKCLSKTSLKKLAWWVLYMSTNNKRKNRRKSCSKSRSKTLGKWRLLNLKPTTWFNHRKESRRQRLVDELTKKTTIGNRVENCLTGMKTLKQRSKSTFPRLPSTKDEAVTQSWTCETEHRVSLMSTLVTT